MLLKRLCDLSLLLKNAYYYSGGQFQVADILCKDGVIKEIGEHICASDALVLDAKDMYVCPGFIDIHLHGAANIDVNASNENDLKELSVFLASQGVTSWLASIITDTKEKTLECIEAIRNCTKSSIKGAQLLGSHLEGPFLAHDYKGTMPASLLKDGDVELLKEYIQASSNTLKYITVAPELTGIVSIIRDFKDCVIFALGHSGASYETSMKAFESGARCVTHTFNAMKLFHQHEPSLMGAALENDCWCEVICDGRHLHPGAVKMLVKCKGWEKLIAVSDSTMATGLPDGRYTLGINDIEVVDGDAKLVETGVRAGSTLTTMQALKNIMKYTNASLCEILPVFTENPAKALFLRNKGRIELGYDADFTILNNDFGLQYTIVCGCNVYSKE